MHSSILVNIDQRDRHRPSQSQRSSRSVEAVRVAAWSILDHALKGIQLRVMCGLAR